MSNRTSSRRLVLSDFTNFLELEGKSVSFVNPYSYWVLKKQNFDFNTIDFWYSDGVLMCWLLRIFNVRVQRFSFDFTSLAGKVFDWCRDDGKPLCVVGSDSKSVASFVDHLKVMFNISDISFRNGYFSKEEYDQFLGALATENPAVVIVGMGTPKQEQFLIDLRTMGWTGVGFTCGGFIHQTSMGKGTYYPRLIDKWNLRFLYRMYKEPNTIKRYFLIYPLSLISITFGVIKGTIRSKQ